MAAPKQQKIVSAHQSWVATNDPAKTMDTVMVIARLTDRQFVKVFPDFVRDVLAAMREKKLAGAGDLIFYLMARMMTIQVNGMEDQIGIPIRIDDVAAITGKKSRAIKKNLRTLLDLGFLVQPMPRIPIYVVPPEYIYRGCFRKLHKAAIDAAMNTPGVSMTQALAQMRANRPGTPQAPPQPPK